MWLGGYQDRKSPSYREPGGGWMWITGEPWDYSKWHPEYPDDGNIYGGSLCDYLYLNTSGNWADWSYTTASVGTMSGCLVEYEPTTVPPRVLITSPVSTASYVTTDKTLAISGYVSDSAALTSVSWSNDRGGSGVCLGTSSWSASGIALHTGINVITINATDAAGNTANGTLTVVLSPEDPPRVPVQWAVGDGGNGHWYEAIVGTYTWFEAMLLAQQRLVDGLPGHLATITSAAENYWVHSNVSFGTGTVQLGVWIGGYQDRNAPSYSEPDGGWTWITGEPWDYPNGPWGALGGYGSNSPCDYLYFGYWGDWGDWSYTTARMGRGVVSGYLVEYEQATMPPKVLITSPTTDTSYSTVDSVLPLSGCVSSVAAIASITWSNDRGGSGACIGTNSWSARGCCLQTGSNVVTVTVVDTAGKVASCTLTVVLSPMSIQWPVSEGGNGHWYEALVGKYSWYEALVVAQQHLFNGLPGHLATITSAAENEWIHANVSLPTEYVQNMFIGGYRDGHDPNSGEPTGGWKWITGETWDYTDWYSSDPGMCEVLYITIPGSWDVWYWYEANSIPGYVVEYEEATVPPKVLITLPTMKASYRTRDSMLDISGYVSDSAAITSVSWSNDRGGSGACIGTNSWSASGIRLHTGDNVITVTSVDAVGNIAISTLTAIIPSPKQWASINGGNGHWYEAVKGTFTWFEAMQLAQKRSFNGFHGHLATITSAVENDWIHANVSLPSEYVQNMWIGGYQNRKAPGYGEPGRGWTWITGEPWDYTKWHPGYPDNGAAGGLWLPMADYLYTNSSGNWVDWSYTTAERGNIPGYIVEYEQATVPPRVLITSPTSNASYNTYNTCSTSDSALSIAGYVSDSTAITSVSWSNNRGGSGACIGTSSWSASGISLQIGSNVITLAAVDALGSTANDTLVVVRSTDPPPAPFGIRYTASGLSVSGITDVSSSGMAEVRNDGGYQKLEYLPCSGLVVLPEPDKWYGSNGQPVAVVLDDLGYTGESGWIPTPRQFTVEGQTWSNDGFDSSATPANSYPWQKITLSSSDGSGGISSGASYGSKIWTYDLGSIVVDLGFPNFTFQTVVLGTGDPGHPSYPIRFEAHAPIAFRYHEVQLPVSIAEAKRLGEGAVVRIKDAVCIFHSYTGEGSIYCFVESSDRSTGIKLVNLWGSPGQRVDVIGRVARVDGEWQIAVSETIRITPGDPIRPLGVNTRTIGNDSTETLSYRGLDTTGLRVRISGVMTAVTPAVFPRIMYVDDGGGYQDGLGIGTGIRVHIPSNIAVSSIGAMGWVTATGISRVEKHTSTVDSMVNGTLYPAGTVIYVPSIWCQWYPDDLLVDPPL